MKLVVIPDVHGQDDWKRIIKKEGPDKVIFLGDYFDSFNIAAHDQKNNFLDIVDYARANPSTIMLYGNHDIVYLRGATETYSGYQRFHAIDIRELLESNKDLFSVVHQHDNILFSHAGVSKTWLKSIGHVSADIVDYINQLFLDDQFILNFNGYNNYGDDITQGPTWIRPRSLLKDKIEGFIQIVGHTVLDKIHIEDNVYFVDTMQTSKEYLVINKKISIKKLGISK